jgi:membrane associated rhomboid family serine protease
LKSLFSVFFRPAAIWGIVCILLTISYILLQNRHLPLSIYPRTTMGLLGILTAPFIHGSWEHLYSNLIPLFVLGMILHAYYSKIANEAVLEIYLLTGLWVWLGARSVWHIGASGIVYGLAFFLFWIGVFRYKKDNVAFQISFISECWKEFFLNSKEFLGNRIFLAELRVQLLHFFSETLIFLPPISIG